MTDLFTFPDELVVAEEALVVAGVVGLEDEFHLPVHGDERFGDALSTEAVLRVLHPVRVNREDVHVVKQATGSREKGMRCEQMGPVDVNESIHTARKQHQRKNVPICVRGASRVLCGLGLDFVTLDASNSRFHGFACVCVVCGLGLI